MLPNAKCIWQTGAYGACDGAGQLIYVQNVYASASCSMLEVDTLACSVQTAVLDRNAKCCESGKLDACGACDGGGQLIDVQNV